MDWERKSIVYSEGGLREIVHVGEEITMITADWPLAIYGLS